MGEPRLLVATRKGLFRFRRKGDGWTAGPPSFLAEPVSAVLADPRDGALYAALRLGHFGVKLHRSDDGGDSWTELPAPAFPAAGDGDAAAPSVDMIWTLEGGGADRPGVLFAGTLPGGLFRSADRGQSWALVRSLWDLPERASWSGGGYDIPGIHSIRVDPRDSRRITLAVSVGGIWKSDDGGDSWRVTGHGLRADYQPPGMEHDPLVQDPHRLAFGPADSGVAWCQHHNGIFRSDDDAERFVELSEGARPYVFGFAVAAHPHDPATAWFVPAVKDECRVPVGARLAVRRTRDGGRSWETLTDGLPAGDSYDLVYRHALDVDGSGRHLAMGSTTGNLWSSDDGGERWSLVSANLPPIAQVAFA
ncbi:MAG: hypothetical protein U1E14_11845 [Geminicoccaceae bacterium]